jgi:hypothetical protein
MNALQCISLTRRRQREEVTILVIDDDLIAVELMEAMLTGEAFGFSRRTAAKRGLPWRTARCRR